MRLEKLSVFNFKNYAEASVDFDDTISCFLGRNGSGKTNLLDAIYYLSFTRSFLTASDVQNIRLSQTQFFIKGLFTTPQRQTEILTSFQQGQKKVVRENGVEYGRFSEHIGKYPVVLVAPQDIELIWDGSEVRRKFVDTLICQLDKFYLDNLIIYNSYLKQRNSALRIFADKGSVDYDLLESYDEQLVPAATYIFSARKSFVHDFAPRLIQHYQFLSGEAGEFVSLSYRSELDQDNWADMLRKNLSRDLVLQRTSTGIHRDDFLFFLNGHELKRFGSQGQQKSFLIGLKLAEFQTITDNKGLKPLLLLDDIFDKLDDVRIQKLMSRVANHAFGQIFITDARPSRTKEIIESVGLSSSTFGVESGTISPLA